MRKYLGFLVAEITKGSNNRLKGKENREGLYNHQIITRESAATSVCNSNVPKETTNKENAQ